MSYALRLHIGNKEIEVKLREQEKPSTNSIQFGGRNYSIQYPEEQKEIIKSAIEKVLKQNNGVITFDQFQERVKILLNTDKTNQIDIISKLATTELSLLKKTETIEGQLAKTMDKYLETAHQLFSFSGTVLIKKEGKTILCKGYGLASENVPNTPETVFQIASVTKQFTAAAILKLVQEGKIKLDDPIRVHLPLELYSNKWEGIQIHHLLCHRSGLANNDECKAFKDAKKAALDQGHSFEPSKTDLIHYFKDMDLVAQIDEKTHYSNFGYYLLGAILEYHNASKPYGECIKELLPDEMASTGYYKDHNNSNLTNAIGYHLNDQANLSPHIGAVAAEAYAAGGLYSTVKDLATWNHALLNGKIISKDLLQKMTMSYGTDIQTNQNFGYGFEVDELAGKKAIFHGGTIDGYKAQCCVFPHAEIDKSDTIILLANNYDIPEIAIRNSLASILNEQEFKDFSTKTFDPNFPTDQEFHLEGQDKSNHQFIKERDKYYILQPPNENDQREKCLLVPLTNGHYLNIKYGTEWAFTSNEATSYRRGNQPPDTLKKY